MSDKSIDKSIIYQIDAFTSYVSSLVNDGKVQ